MDAYTQERRLLRIDTVLGRDHVLLVSLRGRDSISSFFSFDLEIASTDPGIEAGDLLGTAVTIRTATAARDDDRDDRHAIVNGIVSRFAVLGRSAHGLRFYRLQVVPGLWFLTQTSDCRIFQELNVREIVDKILTEYQITNSEWRLAADHPTRDYCVQYNETAYDFICRLLEEEGIFFYFRHDEHGHTVVFSDNNFGLSRCAMPRVAISAQVGTPGAIWEWETAYRFHTGQWAMSDYNFEMPSTNLTTRQKTVNPVFANRPFGFYDYPGRYRQTGSGEAAARLRIEREEASYQEFAGCGACADFAAGACFSASGPGDGEEYLITSVEHLAEDWSLMATEAKTVNYSNQFRCALRSVPYRPEMKTPRPRISGTQTAVVTGPAEEEIFTDKYGRVKIQFFWDRQGKKDAHSSCFIRVAQSWAGRSFGASFLPRIGHEVVVAFEEGDPDRPLVVGSVYNAENMVPFSLPANRTQSGLRTRSSIGGNPSNFNELRFEDSKGSEEVYLHAERDLTTEAENNASRFVGHDESIQVDHDRSTHIRHNDTWTVDGDLTRTVHGNESATVDKNLTETVHGNETRTVDKNLVEAVHGNETLSVDAHGSRIVGLTDSLLVGTTRLVTVGGSQTIVVGKDQTITVGASEIVTIGKDRATTVGGDVTLTAGKKITITAGDELVLAAGSARITLKKDGSITIDGNHITIEGSGKVTIRGSQITQN